MRSAGTGRLQIERSLTLDQWRAVISHVEAMPREEPYFRLSFVLWLAVTGGMRRSELAAATLGAIQPGPLDPERGQTWELVVIGKRDRRREVPLPDIVMRALRAYLHCRGIDATYPNWPAATHLIVTLARPFQKIVPAHQPVSHDAIHGMLTRLFRDVADKVAKTDWVDAERLRRSSSHWLRHTFAARSLDNGADLRHVQQVLGHLSLTTTSQYAVAERRDRSKTVARFAENLMAATLPLPLED